VTYMARIRMENKLIDVLKDIFHEPLEKVTQSGVCDVSVLHWYTRNL
jgi:hypothetical protein